MGGGGEEGACVRVAEVCVRGEDRAARQLRGSDALIQGEARIGAWRKAEEAGDQPAGADLVRGQPPVAVGVLQGDVAAGEVGSVVDERLGQPVPAGGLHRALDPLGLTAEGEAPVARQVEVVAALQQVMGRLDAPVIFRPPLDLGIGAHGAGESSERERRRELAVELGEAVGAGLRFDLTGGGGHEAPALAAGCPGHDVQETADLAGAVDGGGGSAQDLHPLGGADRRRVGAPVLDALETVEIGLRQRPAERKRAGHPVVAVGEAPRRDGHEVVDGAHAIALQRLGRGEGGGAGGLQERLVVAEHGGGGALLQKTSLVAGGDDHCVDGGLRSGLRQRGRGEGRGGEQGQEAAHGRQLSRRRGGCKNCARVCC